MANRPLGVLGSPPLGHHPAVLGARPWLFGATRTQGKAHLNTSEVLGPLPWLFVNEHTAKGRTGHTADRAATGGHRHTRGARHARWRMRAARDQLQGLGCLQATCTLPLGSTRPGHGQANTEHWVRPGFGHQRAALPRSAAQGVRTAHLVLSKPCKFIPRQRVKSC